MAVSRFSKGGALLGDPVDNGGHVAFVQRVRLDDGTGTPVTGGDASAANQTTQITAEQAMLATLGATNGAAVVTDATGTIQQYLRGIVTKLIAQLPAALAANGGLKIEGVASGVAVPVTGPQTNTEFIAALKSGTATHSSVASGTSSVSILASNANRKGARIFNTDANNLFLDLTGGTAVAATRAQVKLALNEGYTVEAGYTGAITGIWAADGSGVASVAEFT